MSISNIIYVALLSSFIFTLLEKWGIREQITMRAPKLISEMSECDFCLTFWIDMFLSILFLIFTGDWSCLLIPFFATPLFRIIL